MSDFKENRPKESDEQLLAIFRELNKRVFNDELPEIPIGWSEDKMHMGGYAFSPDRKTVADNYILVSREVVDRQLETVVCHEMVHYKTQLIDFEKGVEFLGPDSCCPNGELAGHNGMFITIGEQIHEKFGIRIDQLYNDTLKSALEKAGEENWKDDGKDYDYTFYKFNNSVMMQKIDPDAPHMDKFPVFHGRVEELNDVPPTKGNPFDDRNFSREFINVYARPVDKYTKREWNFIPTGATYRTADESCVEILLAMKNLGDLEF